MNEAITPKPGVYYNTPFAEYLLWDAVSNSRLGLAKRSAAHYKAGFQGEPTPAMQLGSLVHLGVLEPLKVAERYCFMPDFASDPRNTTKDGDRSFSSGTVFCKAMAEEFRRANADKEVVPRADYDRMVGIATSLHANDQVRDMFRYGRAEISLAWEDEDTGLLCKMRADWIRGLDQENPAAGHDCIVLDLKTTQDAIEFERSIVRYGYHRQMAFYRRGIAAAFGAHAVPWILAVETSAPYGCRIAPMAEDFVSIGESEVSELLQFVAECRAMDHWPGYSNPTAWECPHWAVPKTTDGADEELATWFASATSAA